ncbi:MAG: hypothetical protein A4E71_02919 [Smithella sp. PtaU1.Bin162]|nr:MAG: hypothetical protein A4E71_02919 [Smithella sp. PtaU1.Bin162]
MTYKKHQWQQRVRNEFQEPAKEVIISFAKDRYSKRLTAAAIGINIQTLIAYARKNNINFANRKDLRDECKAHTYGNCNNPWGRYGRERKAA